MYLVDTHLHLWDLDQFPYSWTQQVPPLARTFTMDDYGEANRRLPIFKAVFMEADVDAPHALAEAQHVQNLARRYPIIRGIIASARPEAADFSAQLDALGELPLLRGIRRVLHTQADDLPLTPAFLRGLVELGDRGLPFDYCALPRQLGVARDVIGTCDGTAFVLDHGGIPNISGGEFDTWAASIEALAELPNLVACKISGLVAYAQAGWTPADLQPWFEHLVACFGWDRLVWGSDWPVCNLGGGLSTWVEALNALTANASPAEQAKLFHANAERIYHV